MTTAGGEVAHCTGAGWLASYVEKSGSFGHFLSPQDHYMSGGKEGGDFLVSTYFIIFFLLLFIISDNLAKLVYNYISCSGFIDVGMFSDPIDFMMAKATKTRPQL